MVAARHVEDTKEFYELATAMAISDQGMDLPGQQVIGGRVSAKNNGSPWRWRSSSIGSKDLLDQTGAAEIECYGDDGEEQGLVPVRSDKEQDRDDDDPDTRQASAEISLKIRDRIVQDRAGVIGGCQLGVRRCEGGQQDCRKQQHPDPVVIAAKPLFDVADWLHFI
jgi:hypothetical protein